MLIRTTTILLAATLVASCDSDSSSPAGPTPIVGQFAGTWTGTVSRTGSTHSLRLILGETQFGGVILSGTYTLGEGASAMSGTAGGAAPTARDVLLTLTPTTPTSCPQPQPFPAGGVSLELILEGTRLSGSATFLLCGESVRGTASLSK